MLDYKRLAQVIKARARCSMDEAWDGLSRAFLSLDKSRTESEQAAYLLMNGVNFVYYSLRYKYNSSGELRFVPIDEHRLAVPSWDYEFLNRFPAGNVREFAQRVADGECSFTPGAASHWLRSVKHINTRTSVRNLMESTKAAAFQLLLEKEL